MERRTTNELLNLRSRLTRVLASEPSSTVSAAQERILEQRFFAPTKTPVPARVLELSASRSRPRL